MSHNLLVEIGTEELPPTSLLGLSQAFSSTVAAKLKDAGLSHAAIVPYASPRRLGLSIEGLLSHTPKQQQTLWGPPAKIAFDEHGKPTKAALAFANKNAIHIDDLESANDGKIDKLVYHSETGGVAATALLPEIIETALAELPVKKRMRWGATRTEFVRPVQWVLMLLDDTVIDCSIMGIAAANSTRGHRFHANHAISVKHAKDYASVMRNEARVIASFTERQAEIKKQVEELGESLGGVAVISPALLEEVCALVEWPVALAGKFDEAFLTVPHEALIYTMRENQKYFHITAKNGELMPYFITIANLDSTEPTEIIKGNEKVVRARLNDAAFFFNTDKKTPLATRREKLSDVTFQAELGSVLEKCERIEKLATFIADRLGMDREHVARAAHLSKCDLVTNMVYEFPEMQGHAGYYYALRDGENTDVATALREQYLPRFSGDQLPVSEEGVILALADRLDTLTGIFGIGQVPTGSKDPFALRRASLAALRLLVEKELDLDLQELIETAAANFSNLSHKQTVVPTLLTYMLDRFRSWYEEEGIHTETFLSVAAKKLSHPLDINRRVHAVAAFTQLPEAAALAAANKRVSNILAKLDTEVHADVDVTLFKEQAEKDLATQITQQQQRVAPLLAAHDYQAALQQLASLRDAVDRFFAEVMVMDEDLSLRNNRLALLKQLRSLFLHIADISLLAVKK